MADNELPRTDEPALKADSWFTPGRFALLLAGMIFIHFADVILGLKTFFYRDYGFFTYPIAFYHKDCFWRGEIPLWDPFNQCGVPLLAQWNTSFLYPPSLFYLIFPLPWSLGVFNLAHLFFAGMGMYFLAKRWTGTNLGACLAGAVFAINGLSLNMIMWVSNLAAYAWMPWVVLAVEHAWRRGGRRRVVIAALAGGMQMLSGAPEPILFTWLILGVLWLIDFASGEFPRGRMTGVCVVIVVLVAGLSSAQLLPFLELIRQSNRESGSVSEFWPMPVWGWANFFVPLFHNVPSLLGVFKQYGQVWTSSYYLGVGTMALAFPAAVEAFRRRQWRMTFMVLVALGGVALAMGGEVAVLKVVKLVFPQVTFMRFPIKFVVLTTFAVPLLAASTFSRLAGADAAFAGVGMRQIFNSAGVVFVFILLALAYSRFIPIDDERWPVTLQSGLSRAGFLGLMMAVFWMMAATEIYRRKVLAGVMIILLFCLDTLSQGTNQNPTVPMSVYDAPSELAKSLDVRPGESRAMVHPHLGYVLSFASTANYLQYYPSVRKALVSNCNLLDKIPTTTGFVSLDTKYTSRFLYILNIMSDDFPIPLAKFVGVSKISSRDTTFTWTNFPDGMPLVTAGQSVVCTNDDETFRIIASPEFAPRATVYLPTNAIGAIHATNDPSARVTMRKFADHSVEFETTAAVDTMAVVAQSFYPCWHAYVDGVTAPLWRANGAFQAVEVPAGRHSVTIKYEDRAFGTGVGFSIVSILLCLGGLRKEAGDSAPDHAKNMS
jgi:hypothetical protein